ncbi:MAG TPA: Ig-like domain-containing protein [Chitinispirillaceae bacterium]|nr:Ig-like domain-containing protein [Chitinispirillaceae bacterium]
MPAQSIAEGSLLQINAIATDIDNDPLTYSALQLPSGASFVNGLFSWTPNFDQSGKHDFYFSVSDQIAEASLYVPITVTDVNRAPVANTQSVSTNEDNALAISLSGSDPDGAAVTYQISSNPTHGILSGTVPNLTYTPDANYNGSDAFTFSVSDGSLSAQATVSITVNAVNDAPVLNPIAAQSVKETSALTFTATGSDIDGNTLTFSAVSLPSGATFNNGIFTWTPTYEQAGSYTITVSLSDGTATVTKDVAITVSNLNRAPVAKAQSVTTDEDNAVTMILSGSDPDGEALSYTVITQPEHGTLSGTAPNLTYTPNANYNGSDAFTFSVSDGSLSAQATVSITVNAVNDAPVLNPIAAQSVKETSTLTFTATGSDIDGNTLTFSATNLLSGATFNNGIFTWTPTYEQAGSYTITVSLGDGTATVTKDVAITVSNLNRAPVAKAQNVTTDEDNAVTMILSGSDPDGEALSYTVITQPEHGTLSGTAPNLTYTPDADYNGSDAITFSVSDGSLSAQATVSITVNAVNDAPVLNPIAAQSVEETSTLTFTATGSDIDADALTFSATNLPEGASFNNGTFTWTPTFVQAGSYTITISISDGNETASQEVAITVANLNREPDANAQSITTDEDKAVAVTLAGGDPDGEVLSYSVVAQPEHGTLSGTAPNLTYTPDADYNGSDAITFSVSDGSLSAQATVSITVNAVNDVPVLNAIAAKTVNENSMLTFTVKGSDVDGDELTFSALNLPTWASFKNGTFIWTPAFDQAGNYTITVTASDGRLSTSSEVSISVINTLVQAKVYMYDEAMTNPVASNPRLYVVNTSNETISNCRIEYYFSSENGKVPQLDKYYTANAKVILASRGNGDYTIVYDLTGINIAPGAIYPNAGGMVVGIHYQDWSTVNITNDYSNNRASSYAENNTICVYTKDNSMLGGLKPSNTALHPFANAGSDIWGTSQQITLDGSRSYDLLEQISSYAWIINDNVVSTDINPSITFEYGATKVSLRVTNTAGLTSIDDVNVFVQRDTDVLFSLSNIPVPVNTPVTIEYNVPSKIANASITLEAQNAWGSTNVLTMSGTSGHHKEQIWSWNKNGFGGCGPWTVKCKVNGAVKQTLLLKFGY